MRARRLTGRAFTLVEVVLVVGITALVMAAVVPLSLSIIERADARAVVDRLSAAVRLATAEAARRGVVVTLCVREWSGGDADLVLRLAPTEPVVELGVEMPRGWRVEGVQEGAESTEPSGEEASKQTLTPVGSAFPDGRFVGLAVVATTAERGAAVNTPVVTPGSPGEAAVDAPARLGVRVDALNGRVSLEPVEGGKGGATSEPGLAPEPPQLPARDERRVPAMKPPEAAPAPAAGARTGGGGAP